MPGTTPGPVHGSEHYDLVIIGGGPAGEKGAAQAAYFGKRVCLIERAPKPGGAAINTGTIPSKTLRETALYFSGLRQRGLYGVDYQVKHDITIADFMFRERAVVSSEWSLIEENLRRHHVTTYQGAARFLSPVEVEIARFNQPPRHVTGEIFLIATGSQPVRPADVPFDGAIVVDSDSLLRLSRIPNTMIVVGGGIIGCEYACIFAALGVRVTLLNSRERLLTQLDAELSEALRARMTGRLGIKVITDAEVTSVQVHDNLGHVTLTDGTELGAEVVLYSTGREGCTGDLALDIANIDVNRRGYIVVDEKFRTSAPGVYAVGDVVGFPALASTSMEQARVAMCHAFDLKYKQRVSPVLPYGVWTIPEIAMVGETEESARGKDLSFETGRASYRLNARGQITGDTEGFIKLIFRTEDQRLLGASIIGEGACELIHVAMACMAYEGTIDFFIQSVFNYPTYAEAYKYAAYDGLQRLARRITNGKGLPAIVPSDSNGRPAAVIEPSH